MSYPTRTKYGFAYCMCPYCGVTPGYRKTAKKVSRRWYRRDAKKKIQEQL